MKNITLALTMPYGGTNLYGEVINLLNGIRHTMDRNPVHKNLNKREHVHNNDPVSKIEELILEATEKSTVSIFDFKDYNFTVIIKPNIAVEKFFTNKRVLIDNLLKTTTDRFLKQDIVITNIELGSEKDDLKLILLTEHVILKNLKVSELLFNPAVKSYEIAALIIGD